MFQVSFWGVPNTKPQFQWSWMSFEICPSFEVVLLKPSAAFGLETMVVFSTWNEPIWCWYLGRLTSWPVQAKDTYSWRSKSSCQWLQTLVYSMIEYRFIHLRWCRIDWIVINNINTINLAILLVTFLGWLSDPFKWLSDLQLGDEKVTLNHLEHADVFVGAWGMRVGEGFFGGSN